MSEVDDALARIDTLVQIGLSLALRTTSGRIGLAKLADNLEPDWIPRPWRDSLGSALARASASGPEPLPFAEVERILCSAWGVKKVSAELDSLEPEPAASTFTSQVHRGVREGTPVAVKVLRPGLAGAVRQDLALLDGLLAPLSGAFPGLDPGALLSEARERVMDEFDLENEASVMRRFHRALRDGPVTVPAPVGELCHETVLVSAWLDGTALAAGVGLGHDPSAAALLQFVIGGLREGLVHCDLDLADVLVLGDGSLGVVDFGAVAVVDRDRADLALAVVDAFIAGDAAALDGALAGLGVLAPGHGEVALAVARTVLGPFGEAAPVHLDVAAVTAGRERLDQVGSEAVPLLLAGRLEPADLYPARAVGQLFSLIARLGATGAWRDQVRVALAEGWST